MENQETLTRIADTLDELLAWQRLQSIDHARAALAKALPDETQRRLYQASTGGSTREIAALVGVSDTAVRSAWKRLFRAGLMREDKVTKGRYNRTFDLEDFEMVPPPIAIPAKADGLPTEPSGPTSKKAAKPVTPEGGVIAPSAVAAPKKVKSPPAPVVGASQG